MHGASAETIAIALLIATLGVAVLRPAGISEAVIAVPAAALTVALGIVHWHDAADTVGELGPTVGFLAAILLFGHLCAEAGVFDYLGSLAAIGSRARPRRLLTMVVLIAATVTVVLTLDATIVLLTPVVLAVAQRTSAPLRPHAYACTRLANSASVLLPVSNLTNLLAFSATGLSFGRFAALMAVPWILVCGGEWLGLRTFFAGDLPDEPGRAMPERTHAPRYALAMLVVTVAGIVLCSSLDVAVAWAAVGGCVLLLLPRLRGRDVSAGALLRETNPGFCLFVLALGVVVDGVLRHGLGTAVGHLIPSGTSFVALLALAFLAAALANVVNNLPATLVMLPFVSSSPVTVLAVLLGVNIGPNATYIGSLATLLWRRILPADAQPSGWQFHRFGLLTVPVLLAVCTVALWGGWQLIG